MNSFPNLLLEAFFVGVPLVVSDLPPFREIMDHEPVLVVVPSEAMWRD